MPRTVVSDLVEPITDKQVADQAKPKAYIGLEHIPERAIRIEKAGDTEVIRGMCVRFSKGDILFGKLRPNLRKSVLAPVDGLGSTEIIVLRAKPGVDPSFAGHVLRSETVFSEAERMTEGTRMPRTSWKTLSEIEVFAPSDQHAQKLIAEVLDAIDDAVLETDVLIEKHEAIRLGLLDDLISIPGQIGSSDAPDTLASLVASITSGCSVNADDRPPSAGEFGVLKTSAVGSGRFRPLESKAVWVREVSRLKCPVEAGMILFSRMNTPQLVGENAFVDQDHPGLFLPDRLWAIRVKEDAGVLPEWVATILQTRQARAFITGEATGTSGSMKNIARTSLLRLPLRKLPHADQVDAMKAVHALQAEIDALMSERGKLAALRLGLRDDLLAGRKPVVAIREAAE
jgi:type I restriction enzyme S subunit